MKVEYTADFILTRVRLTRNEYLIGIYENIVTPEEVIAISTLLVSQSPAVPDGLEAWELELAVLLRDEAEEVPPTLLRYGATPTDPDGAWLYLALAWIHDNSEQLTDIDSALDGLGADFDYPDIVYSIRSEFMLRGYSSSRELRLTPSLVDYLREKQSYFASRGRDGYQQHPVSY